MLVILLQQIRMKKNFSLEKLAKLSGVSKSHLSNIERGCKIPSILVLCKVAKALKCEVTDLFIYKT